MSELTKADFLRVIEIEIGWCESEEGEKAAASLDPEYRAGFVAGLRQAKRLIFEAGKIVKGGE